VLQAASKSIPDRGFNYGLWKTMEKECTLDCFLPDNRAKKGGASNSLSFLETFVESRTEWTIAATDLARHG
jgi:hypothetical protein